MADKTKFFLWERWGAWLLLLLIIAFAASIRIRIADMPLERDEGEYAYAGQLLLQGIPPYDLAYNMKLPGTYAAYAVLMGVFGQTPRGIHLGMTLLNAVAIFLMFLLGRKLFNPVAGLVSAASFALLSCCHTSLGMAAHANHFVVLFAVAGLLVLLRAQDSNSPVIYFSSGLLLGMSFLMKQQGVFFILFGVFSIILHFWCNRPWKWRLLSSLLGSFSLGCIVPFGLTCLILWRAGVFGKFWFWTFNYASEYATSVPLSKAFSPFRSNFTNSFEYSGFFWVLALAGIILSLFVKPARGKAIWLLVLLFFSFCALSVGFYFRGHYFLLLWPAVSLLAGAAVALAKTLLPHKALHQGMLIAVCAGFFAHSIYLNRLFFFRLTPKQLMVALYSGNPFGPAEALARYIRENSSKEARIAVLGSEPEIYFLADRHSATGYIYTYGLMEAQPFALQMQKEMAAEIEAGAPEFIAMIQFNFSWLRRSDSNPFILEWLNRYTANQYEIVALLIILAPFRLSRSGGQTIYSTKQEGRISLFFSIARMQCRSNSFPPPITSLT
ncbi:MAG: hypothetical protein JWM68_4681 [Verrucomicrobiales bacterium]|nr:hypothetical protein [Verrucomicrobiales bacterium]